MKVNVMTIPKIRASNEERRALRPIGRNADQYQALLQELEELAVFLDDHGYDSMSTVEHHFHTEGLEMMPNWLLFSAKLAARTKRLAFMPLSIVLPSRDPLLVAEDIALFDQMYPGRLQVCFARGYQKRWMQTLMQDTGIVSSFTDRESDAKNREIFNEHLEVILRALTEDAWSYKGKHYEVPFPFDEGITGWAGEEVTREFGAEGEVDDEGAVRKIGVVPAPLTKPYPEMFIPFSGSPQTLTDSAKRDFTALILESKADGFRERCESYQQALKAAGRDARLGEKVGAVRLVALGDSHEEAMEHAANTCGWDFWNYFAKFGFMELFRTDEDPPGKLVSLKDRYAVAQRMYETDHLLAGTPDDVCRQMEGLYRCHGDGQLDWFSWEFYAQGNVSLDEQKRQLELFAEKVRPKFP
jgi:alkanesulfonate monooxygenase SsuD/methylene tetrahydromethanopterin reductase-like flavin-dependent oxidoreductase (luciferase family)